MTFFDDRPGAERVQRLFTQVMEARLSLMSVVKLGQSLLLRLAHQREGNGSANSF
jgi:hypothetical protein